MKILYIWDADYPWDIRVEKICLSLVAAGHEVHIASRNLKKLPVIERADGVTIHRLKPWQNDKLNYLLSFPLFFSPTWKKMLDEIIKTNSVDLVIVRDLPMAIGGIWAGKRSKIPVIFDMAEDYVAMIQDIWKARKFQGLNLVIRNPYFAKFVEHYALKHSDHIMVVVEEASEVVIKKGGGANKITVVSNTPELVSFSKAQDAKNSDIDLIKSRYSAIYTGGIQMGRGIQCVIDAIPKIIQDIPDFLFVIIGDGYAKDRLNKLVIEKSVEKHVLWLGWVDHKELYGYIKACKIGLIPHLVTNHVDTTVPNKIFDYMGCGIPVISSNARPMKRIVEEKHCGVTFESGNGDSLAKAILEIFNSDIDFGKSGEEAIRCKYNWEEDEKRLKNVVEKLVLSFTK